MASVVEIASVLREGDVKALCVEFNLPKEMAWRVPDQSDRAMAPPAGYIAVYEAHLRSGLRLPMPTELESILKALRVPIAQLHANAVRYICTLCIFARKLHQKFKMSGVRVLFKLNRGSEWKSLSPRPGIKINKAIHDSLKNWKNRFFFLKVGEEWPLARDWGEIPEAYFGTPSVAERSAWAWLLKAIEDNPEEFQRDFLVSRAEARKADWGPPSPIQKPTPPVMMMNPQESKGLIIRERQAAEPEGATETSSSSHYDYAAAGFCCGSGSTAGGGRTEEDSPVGAGVILAQPAVKVVPGAAWMESAEEPARDVPEGSRVYVVGSSRVDSPVVARKAAKGKRSAPAGAPEAVREPSRRAVPSVAAPKAAEGRRPVAAPTPEAAREEPAVVASESDEYLDRLLEEVAASFAPGGPSGPSPSELRSKSRPKGPARKIHEGKRLISAIAREVEQRDFLLAEKDAEIAWLDAELVEARGERREEVAALEAVLGSSEAKCASLEAEVARLKGLNDQLNADNKRIAERAASSENKLAGRLTLHEIEGALQARLLEGIEVGRRIVRMVDPSFPVEVINQRNRTALRKEDLVSEPRDSQGGPPAL